MITYRKYRLADEKAFRTMSNDEWRPAHDSIAGSMRRQKRNVESCYVAVDKDKVIGYAYGFILPNETLIADFIYVRPEYRRQGVGRGVLEALERGSGCSCSMAFYNKALHEHYKKLGYSTGENLEVAIKQIR